MSVRSALFLAFVISSVLPAMAHDDESEPVEQRKTFKFTCCPTGRSQGGAASHWDSGRRQLIAYKNEKGELRYRLVCVDKPPPEVVERMTLVHQRPKQLSSKGSYPNEFMGLSPFGPPVTFGPPVPAVNRQPRK